MKKLTFIVTATVIILASLLWTILAPTLFPVSQAESRLAAPHPGFTAPPFTLQTPDGRSLSLADYSGEPVLIFFWASWCSVCKSTMPGLQQVYEDQESDQFEILAVNATSQDTLTNAITYFQAQNYTFPMLLDQDGELAETYQLRALPTAILVGPDGTIRDVVIGSGLSQGYLQASLSDLLDGKE